MRGPEGPAPSPFFLAAAEHLRSAATLGPILDLACGLGRHTLASAQFGMTTIGLDRNAKALQALTHDAQATGLPVHCIRSDIELDSGIPLRPGSLGGALVFRYLWRPACAQIAALLKPGGWLLYETFTVRQRQWNQGPRNPDYLLEEGELPQLFPQLQVQEFKETPGTLEQPTALASLLAQRPPT